MSKILTPTEVADLLRLKRATIYKYVSEKKIPSIKIGSRIFFEEKKVLRWLKSKEVKDIRRYRKG